MSLIRSIGDVIGFLLISLVAIVESIFKFFIPMKYKMKSVAGEIALVTGGGGGLGRLLSLRLADLGAIVVVWDINEKGIEETVNLVQSTGGTCYGYVCDLCDRQDVYRKAAVIRREVGKVSILINNAGIVTRKRFLETSDEEIMRTMDVNIMSHFWTVKAFLPAMLEDNKGHVVSIASLAGHCGIPKLVDYCASKAAAFGFDDALRMEVESEGYNIYTTVVCPYFIRSTGMFDNIRSRFVSSLSPNEVADATINAMRINQKYVILPSYLLITLVAKWLFPWSCVAMFLRGLVTDVSPEHEEEASLPKSDERSSEQLKDQNGVGLHQQLARRISSSERKP